MSKINEYHCEQGHVIITKDTEPRTVTPMFITCPECKSRAYSRMYQVNQKQKPTYQWFIPESIEELKEACLPVYGDVFGDGDYKKMLEMQDKSGPAMYRKIHTIPQQ
jgi:hypothetical protein